MSKSIELLKNALEIVIKNPDLNVEITFKTKDDQVKAVGKKKTEKKDAVIHSDTQLSGIKTEPEKKEPEKPKAGSATIDEFDAAISTKPENKKAETKIKPEVKNTGEKKIIPNKEIGNVEAATEEPEIKEEPKKVALPEGGKYCAACQGTGVGSKGQKCVPCKGTGIEQVTKEPIDKTKGTNGKKDDDWEF